MQIIAEHLSYTFPSGKKVINDLSFSLPAGEKAALIGDNGSGKSTLLRLLTDSLKPDAGSVQITEHHWFVPQHVGQYNNDSIARILQVDDKINALTEIENGATDPSHFELLADDWAIHERIRSALEQWNLPRLQLNSPFKKLSGGEKTRVFLAGITLHQPKLVLMDEPTNHLDTHGREKLSQFILESNADFLIVSHDRQLLNLCSPIVELSSLGLKTYGGNYTFYEEQKKVETESIGHHIHHTQKSIAEARDKHRKTMERKMKLDARGSKKAKKEGLGKMAMNTAQNRAEGSASKLDETHELKILEEQKRLQELKKQQRELNNIRITLHNSELHNGKILFESKQVNYAHPGSDLLWKESLSFIIQSGERVRITGPNGSGKSTLIRLLNSEIKPTQGSLKIQSEHSFLMDQEYSLINREATVLEQAGAFNSIKKPGHELKTLLHRYLFDERVWNQKCRSLSGGEMLRLSLCCMALKTDQPDTILLDEPTNNLDLRNIKLLTNALTSYQGSLIVISHDLQFVKDLKLKSEIKIPF